MLVEALESRVLMSVSPDLGVYAPHATVRGEALSQWTAEWWQWAMSLPVDQNPLFDATGANACRGDVGKAFFLGGVFNESGSAERTIRVPSGTPVFFPVVNVISLNIPGVPPDSTVPELFADAARIVNSATGVHASIDGAAVPDLLAHREVSPVFGADLPENNMFQAFGIDYAGPITTAVTDGYWLMTRPLKPGEHEINFGGTFDAGTPAEFTLDVTYHVDVVPKGQYRKDPCGPADSSGAAARFGEKRIGRIADDVLCGCGAGDN